jgi:hypothetical protein
MPASGIGHHVAVGVLGAGGAKKTSKAEKMETQVFTYCKNILLVNITFSP